MENINNQEIKKKRKEWDMRERKKTINEKERLGIDRQWTKRLRGQERLL